MKNENHISLCHFNKPVTILQQDESGWIICAVGGRRRWKQAARTETVPPQWSVDAEDDKRSAGDFPSSLSALNPEDQTLLTPDWKSFSTFWTNCSQNLQSKVSPSFCHGAIHTEGCVTQVQHNWQTVSPHMSLGLRISSGERLYDGNRIRDFLSAGPQSVISVRICQNCSLNTGTSGQVQSPGLRSQPS